MTFVDGDPNITLQLNRTAGTTGIMQVTDYNGGAPNTKFIVATDGLVTLFGGLHRTDVLRLNNGHGTQTDIAELALRGSAEIRFKYDSGSARAEMYAVGDSSQMRVTGKWVEVNAKDTGVAPNPILYLYHQGSYKGFFKTGGGPPTGNSLTLQADTSLGMIGDDVNIINPGAGTGSMAKFGRTSTMRFDIRYDTVGLVILEAALPTRINNTAAGSGTMAEMSMSSVPHLFFRWDSVNSAAVIETDSGPLADTDLYLKSAANVKVYLDHDNDSNSMFIIHDGAGGNLVKFTESRYFEFYASGGATVMQLNLPTASVNYDAVLDVGAAPSGYRGMVNIQRDSATARQGVIVLQDINGVAWFLWMKTDGHLLASQTDPTTNDGGSGTVYTIGP